MRQKGCETSRVTGAPREKSPECKGLIILQKKLTIMIIINIFEDLQITEHTLLNEQ